MDTFFTLFCRLWGWADLYIVGHLFFLISYDISFIPLETVYGIQTTILASRHTPRCRVCLSWMEVKFLTRIHLGQAFSKLVISWGLLLANQGVCSAWSLSWVREILFFLSNYLSIWFFYYVVFILISFSKTVLFPFHPINDSSLYILHWIVCRKFFRCFGRFSWARITWANPDIIWISVLSPISFDFFSSCIPSVVCCFSTFSFNFVVGVFLSLEISLVFAVSLFVHLSSFPMQVLSFWLGFSWGDANSISH